MDQGRIVMQGKPAEVFSRVAELQALHLEAPLAATVAADLRRAGLNLPQGIITNEELAEALCQ